MRARRCSTSRPSAPSARTRSTDLTWVQPQDETFSGEQVASSPSTASTPTPAGPRTSWSTRRGSPPRSPPRCRLSSRRSARRAATGSSTSHELLGSLEPDGAARDHPRLRRREAPRALRAAQADGRGGHRPPPRCPRRGRHHAAVPEHAQVHQRLPRRRSTRAEEAIRAEGIEIVREPIRSGADGSVLSAKGLPTPNIFTGGHDYHSPREWASVQEMAAAAATVVRLAEAWARDGAPPPR